VPETGSSVVIIGGTSGIGLALAKSCVQQGCHVVITGRDPERARTMAESLGSLATGIGFDLAEPDGVADALRDIDHVDHIVLAALERDRNTLEDYDISRAVRLTTLKLVGYTEVIHTLLPRITRSVESSVVLFGGMAKETPYPGSTTVSTINAGLNGLMRTLALQLSPIRVNSVHPGLVGDTPAWENAPELIEKIVSKTPTKRITQTEDVVQTVLFLLDNLGINAVELFVDGGVRVQPMM
jgi:NAD(P)-dependent dehydrogenase (short-subunit alcohol dehydrogenase family)